MTFLCRSLEALSGLPRLLHEIDLDVEEPLDVDDEYLTATKCLPTLPGIRSKMSSFILICRLSRILSRTLDTLYTTTKRAHATSRIKEMSRICCNHLLSQWQATQREHRAQIQHAPSREQSRLVAMASLNEGLLYRPGLALAKDTPLFKLSLDICADSAASMIETAYTNIDALIYIQENPGAQSVTLWIAALSIIYRVWSMRESKDHGSNHSGAIRRAHKSVISCLHILRRWSISDDATTSRANTLEAIVKKTFEGIRGSSEARSDGSSNPHHLRPPAFQWDKSFTVPKDHEIDTWNTTIDMAFGDLFSNHKHHVDRH